MHQDIVALVSYVLITTFTPGPNNVSAAAAGVSIGVRRALPYMAGISTGFFCLMAASGLFSVFLRSRYGAIAPYLRWVGFAYMLWLAASPFLPHRATAARAITYRYPTGFVLQWVNPKSILYGVTLYATFFDRLAGDVAGVLVSALALTAIGFASILTWATAGSALTRFMKVERHRRAFDIAMAILLAWTAFTIVRH